MTDNPNNIICMVSLDCATCYLAKTCRFPDKDFVQKVAPCAHSQ